MGHFGNLMYKKKTFFQKSAHSSVVSLIVLVALIVFLYLTVCTVHRMQGWQGVS